MSRGLGKIEKTVIGTLQEKGVGCPSIGHLTYAVGEKLGILKDGPVNGLEWRKLRGSGKLRQAYTESLYRSVRRAVRSLEKKEFVYTLDRDEMLSGAMVMGISVGGAPTYVSLNVPDSEDEDT